MRVSRRITAGALAFVLSVSGIAIPSPAYGSNVWPQKSTAPFYCLDGGKSWRAADRYEIYEYDTLPTALTEVQAKRLFWAYPSNWNALKEAAAVYDPELYDAIFSTSSGPNVVKKIKDDKNTVFAWVADHPEIEERAIRVLEQKASETGEGGKAVPEAIRSATSEEHAVEIMVPSFQDGPASLNTEFVLGSDFVSDIAKIEMQSVWDNGAGGGTVGWADASQKVNQIKSVMGDSLYEITWSGDSIKIHNNGSAAANETVIGGTAAEEERCNKTTVRYKISMRENSGWCTEGRWNEDYLHQWMDFKACVNAPGHQRLYMADIQIAPFNQEFYFIVSQGEAVNSVHAPEYGMETVDVPFQIFRHEETFESAYNVKMKKLDDETNMPLKGSQFYLYERFDSADMLGDSEENGELNRENLSFREWSGFQIFSEGTTDNNGEIMHTDNRTYLYSKTYCDGHRVPDWSAAEEDSESDEEEESESEDREENEDSESEGKKDANREAAQKWLELVDACREMEENSNGAHFHWLQDEESYEEVLNVMKSGEADQEGKLEDTRNLRLTDAESAFEKSGCREDCEQTYENFIHLRFSYTWKEVQARKGYILHGIHPEDQPIEIISTNASEAGADAVRMNGNSGEILENIWYTGNNEGRRQKYVAERELEKEEYLCRELEERFMPVEIEEERKEDLLEFFDVSDLTTATDLNIKATSSVAKRRRIATDSDALADFNTATDSNVRQNIYLHDRSVLDEESVIDDGDWESSEESGDFYSYFANAERDSRDHLDIGDSEQFSYADLSGAGRDYWIIKDHRTEGEIHINKRDMDLYKGESEQYSSYGDTEGDGTLKGAVYGLFASKDILHPDSDLMENGLFTNTGIVYQKNDLVAVAETDAKGNASFMTYTISPGMEYDYASNKVVPREDTNWGGPVNRYEENQSIHGNWWIGRPLILGDYYVKELSRNEGFELSVNGRTQVMTNYGAGFDTPEEIVNACGTAVVSMEEMSVSMEGEDAGGTGYDELPFSVTSSGTVNTVRGSSGYQLVLHGFPEGTTFYRIDSGEMEVSGPRVTGTEEVIMKDEVGNTIWKTAKSDSSHVKYEPKYDEKGNIVGQIPMMRTEYQQMSAERIPQMKPMEIRDWTMELEDDMWYEAVSEVDVETGGALFCLLKAELERFLFQNGYGVPVTADGKRSEQDAPVYHAGVLKGETDPIGLTTVPGEPAVKTVYGEAIQEVWIENMDSDTMVYELLEALINWYCENPQWSFGGIHSIEQKENSYKVTLYAGISSKISRRFFTATWNSGQLAVEHVYAVYENPKTLRWAYQQYEADGVFQYQIHRQYSYGSGPDKRYYIDASLAPVMMADANGDLQPIEHKSMVYHKKGERIVDYLAGDPENNYQVPEKENRNIIEIATERELAEQDVFLENVVYDEKTGIYTIQVESKGIDGFGRQFSDENERLVLSFMAKLPKQTARISEADLEMLGSGNIYGYRSGEEIGYAEYLIKVHGATIHVAPGGGGGLEDTYIAAKSLIYRGQHKIAEDGDSKETPVQVLERPVKQKVKVMKEIEGESAIRNFRFKIYLKANLERLFCDENGTVTWLNVFGEPVDVNSYKTAFPELVQNFYTKAAKRPVLERIKKEEKQPSGQMVVTECYNYEKFFDAIQAANADKWDTSDQKVKNTSFKPFAYHKLTGILNQINTSEYAVENAKRSDAVRQFAVTWYLENQVKALTESIGGRNKLQAKSKEVTYTDEIYDQALYQAILEAENYLNVFFQYDLDSIYAIAWDSVPDGGIDNDKTTLSADHLEEENSKAGSASGISLYLPYGEYVLTEQQPYNAEWKDLPNREYKTDTPEELSLPVFYDEQNECIYSSLVPWSVTEPGEKKEMSGYASPIMVNRRYGVTLRVEKYDFETGEPILHDGAVFALYKAERDDGVCGDGCVKRYEKETLISGSRQFLQAMGASEITPFRKAGGLESGKAVGKIAGAGGLYTGRVAAGTPICQEEDCIVFGDSEGLRQGNFSALSTVKDCADPGILQTTGFFETPEQVDAGAYVLAELLVPAGYTRMKPVPVEVYSDAVIYYPDGDLSKTAAMRYGDWMIEEDVLSDADQEYARIFIQNTATSLAVSKRKTMDAERRMKISGRVEGSISALDMIYGLENLELAYNSFGSYLGYGWKKGTLEYLEGRKNAGERIELVYENGVFQGYGYVIRSLETADDENSYVAGATMALFEAIEIQKSGNTEDFAWKGIEVIRDRNGNVTSIFAKEGYAGEKMELQKSEDGTWALETVMRPDTPVLFYDLGNLKVFEYGEDGKQYGYDRKGTKIQITFDTDSVFAIRNGKAEFEITGGDFSSLVYDWKTKAFTSLDENTRIYHLDEELCRDALVDGYTGLAYVENYETGGRTCESVFVWPVTEIKNIRGQLVSREKILTGRPGEKNEGTEHGYITGSVWNEGNDFKKEMNPVYNRHGLVQYYPENSHLYKKGSAVYDRDGEYMGYRYEDLLELFNSAAYDVLDPPELYSVGNPEEPKDDIPLQYRNGESWIVPNIWVSGEETAQDPSDHKMTFGKEDILRRMVPGTYIMEELLPPDGYTKALPVAVSVEETEKRQRVLMTDERIKVEIAKVDGTDTYKKKIISDHLQEDFQYNIEGKSGYSGQILEGVKLALYKAERVYTTDYTSYPKGYYLKKAENTPVDWYLYEDADQEPVRKEAIWISGDVPKYFEGIPAGDYILEELDTPAGFIPDTMEITVENTSGLQSFIFYNDHTKLEIDKFEMDETGTKRPLRWPGEAKFTLYPALMDTDGNVLMEDGNYLYDSRAVAAWKTGGQLDYAEELMRAYEEMFQSYSGQFQQFSWSTTYDGTRKILSARLGRETVTENGETVTQIWELEDGSSVRITGNSNDGKGKRDANGYPEPVFEYQFHYKKECLADGVEIVSYDLSNGIHRLDYIPSGAYVLVETEVPEGYESAAPKLITVEAVEAVQRVSLENRKKETESPRGTLVIEKRDCETKESNISGAWFQVKNLQNGETFRVVTDENGQAVLEDLPIEGVYESGMSGPIFYEVREVIPPEGYCLNSAIWQVRFSKMPEELTRHLVIENEKTEISISKRDFSTEYFVPGARLAVYRAELQNGMFTASGDALDRWISDDKPHVVKGRLSAGKTYLLVEEEAPSGYVKTEPTRFTISEDGRKIVELSKNRLQIQVNYDADGERVESISVTGRAALERRWLLESEDACHTEYCASGKDIFWKEVLENEMDTDSEKKDVFADRLYHVLETIVFADGSEIPLEKMYFRLKEGSRFEPKSDGDYPVGTEYALKDSEGILLEQWQVKDGVQTYHVINEKNQDGEFRLKAGQNYQLEERIVFQNGDRRETERISFEFDGSGNLVGMDAINRKTEVSITKLDVATGRELSGAVLTVQDKQGAVLDQWISGAEPHIVQGTLVPGELYILTEVMAADGYAYEESMEFWMDERGGAVKIYMEDQPTYAEIHKTDLATGEELPGAELVLKDTNGVIVDQWISGKTAHVIKGRLIAGETYTLSERIAPDGYELAEEIPFLVSLDGTIDRVVMADQKKEKRPNKPEPEETIPEKPLESSETKTYGRITAVYKVNVGAYGNLHLELPEQGKITLIPQTGDQPIPFHLLFAAVLAMAGCLMLFKQRTDAMENRETEANDTKME